ncbi:polyprotein [Marmot sapelovirus 2]|nr:polyprotein [Marmot sapelovirus 2]
MIFMVTTYRDKMAVLTRFISESPEMFIVRCTCRSILVVERVIIIVGAVAYRKRIGCYLSNIFRRMRVSNTGASASRNSSGNKHQYASAGGNITQINYYGSDYSMAKADPTNNMDPSAFTKPAVELMAMAGPALKSPTVEECGYSDRIIQLTSGNSAITTQEAANAVVAYGVWPEHSVGVGEAVDQLTEPGPAVERFYTLNSVSWTTAWTGVQYRLPGALADLGMFGQNCFYHYLMRSGFCVHVQINASKFHQGMVLVVAIPECQEPVEPSIPIDGSISDQFWQWYPLHQLTLFPHQFINLRTNNSATLILPYVNAAPAECAITHNYWTVCIIPVVPLAYSTGASTTIPITVSIAPMAASFSGLRQSVPVPQGVPVFTIPGSGQFMTTLRNEGFPTLPDFEATHSHRIPGRVHNLLEIAQVDTMCSPGQTSPYLALDVSNNIGDGPIASWDMSLQSTLMSTTTLARLAKWFMNYRGSVQLTFTFCGSAMATGKFLIAYTPPGGDPPTTRTNAMLGTHIIWDVGLQSSCTLVVPWISQTQYRFANVSGNSFSYAGYITFWYQTAVVVPPNTPTTCQIVVFASACKDFQMRLPTDNAYFQGIGDDLGKVIQDKVGQALGPLKNELQNVPALPATQPTKELPDKLSVQSGESSALTATETGLSATVEPGMVMETRAVTTTFSGLETDIENFFSKYALFYEGVIDANGNSTSTSMVTIPLRFADTSTQPAILTKYRMFTYVRTTFDLVILMDRDEVGRYSSQSVYDGDVKRFQALYAPPGAPIPTTWDSSTWYVPTTPSIYFNLTDPPACARIPFVGPCQAYASFYDGFANFDRASTYGEFPGNNIGTLCIRSMTKFQAIPDVSGVYRVRCFARPVNVEVFCPRPIVSLKQQARVSRSKGRIEVVEDGEDIMELRAGPFGTDFIVRNTGPLDNRSVIDLTLPTFRSTRLGMQAIYHGVALSDRIVVIPFHFFTIDIEVVTTCLGEKAFFKKEFQVLILDPELDVAVLLFDDELFEPSQIVSCACEKLKTTNTCTFNKTIKGKVSSYCVSKWMDPSAWIGAHMQHCMIEIDKPIPPGWCGSPLYCKHGVHGIATASSAYRGYFTMLRVVSNKIDRLPRFQGPADWFNGIAEAMGNAFGSGLSESVLDNFRLNNPTDGIRWDYIKTVVSWLVKIICAMVLIAESEHRASTALILATMLGIDLAMSSPFDWLKEQICKTFGIKPPADQQGPMMDWVKDFNAACTAAKGLEWIGDKIQQFITWVKKLFEKEDPRRKRFMEQLRDLPVLMENIDKIMAHRGQYPESTIKKICGNMRALKRGADIYGVERNAATTQIVSYYKKAMSILQSMSKGRVEPVAVLIHGSPGTGKSLATEIIGRALCQAVDTSRPYCLPPDPKHFDGYAQQHVVIMDDVGQNPDGEDLKLFCQMVSSTEFQVPMAALEEKGMLFTSPYVLCSTNHNQLRPPTISEPEALMRRFFMDLEIIIDKDYRLGSKLDAAKALEPCERSYCENFRKCCPMLCGKAIHLKDRRNNILYSIDNVVSKIKEEFNRRRSCGSKLDAIFQGPGDCSLCDNEMHQPIELDPEGMWLESDYDREANILMTYDEQVAARKIEPKPIPREMIDLIRAVPNEDIIKYCAKQGWILPPQVEYQRAKHLTKAWINTLMMGMAALSALASVGTIIYLLYKVFASRQGAYTGHQQTPLKKPELRRQAVVQGPDLQFATKILNQSLFDVQTDKGHFTGLGLYDTWILVPTHSSPDGSIYLEGVEHTVLDVVDLQCKKGPLELTAVKIDRPIKFRDIRKFIPDHFSEERDCQLVVHNENFRRMFCPVGTVRAHGFLNLSFQATYNTCSYNYPTRSGQCGGVVLKAGKIIALHIGGDGHVGYGAILKRSFFADLQGQIVKEQPARRPVNMNTRTALHPSVFHTVFPGDKEPAALHPKDKRLGVDLEKALFAKYKGNVENPFEKELAVAVDHYVDQISPLMPPDLTVALALEDVVYGIENLDGLDLHTSAGYPYVTMGIRKRDLIPERGEPLTRLQDALDLYGYDLPYVTYLKDELRPSEKIRMGKTRLIECSSMNDTIRMKRTFGRFFQTFHRNPGTVTGSAVGCDPDVHWSSFKRELGDGALLAFDYSNYDASLSPFWFEGLKQVLRQLGYSEQQVKVIDHVTFSTHIYKNTEYTVDGGMPSGCSGTSIFNSIINNLIIRTLVLKCYKGVDLNQLKIVAYGDDVVCTYPYPLDAAILAEEGRKAGLTMTPPDKTTDFNETTWENVTFLKRRFVPDVEFPFLVHPVYPMKEVHESIRWCRSAATTQEHVTSLCHLAWHNGEEEYEQFLAKVRSVPVGRALVLPSYRVLRYSWLDKF